MKITQYSAISIDGFIAKSDGNSDWVSEADVEFFDKEMQKAGCIIVGRTTFEQYKDELYPVKGVTNVVITSEVDYDHGCEDTVCIHEASQKALEIVEKMGHKEALLVGGGKTNASFLQSDLIDEIILSIHPLILGNGIKLFDDETVNFDEKLGRISTRELDEGLVQVRYILK